MHHRFTLRRLLTEQRCLINQSEKCKEKADICNAIGAHHDEVEMTSLLAPIVQVCDAISGARPDSPVVHKKYESEVPTRSLETDNLYGLLTEYPYKKV